ncbi:Gfo/Idh/MocA family protein [Nocardioides dilutus]
MTPTRWAILGPGRIARTFASDLALVAGAELVAVGSRSAERARAFAQEFDVESSYGSYEELVSDPRVDVVYIASPHALHLEHARLAFEAGKHVLCEKPLTLSVPEAEEMVALAARHDRFLMEAMWTACHPVILEVRRRIQAGDLGSPRHLHAELGFVVPPDASTRMHDPALGASALLDMGVYPLTLAHLMLGEAEELVATAQLSTDGIDLDVAISGRYPGGALATMTASMTSWSSDRAEIATDAGRLSLEPFHHPDFATWVPYAAGASHGDAGGDPQRISGAVPVIGHGFGHEIAEVGRCLEAGLRESPLVPHAQTLTILRQMDDVRRQVGVAFPTAGG